MVQLNPTHVKAVWDAWNIRGMVIISLSIQTILIILAPLRKRTPNRFLALVLWLSYLLADWSAIFAVSLIARNQGKDSKQDDPPQDKKLMALLAPFLLLHLGGPDTITAYSIEDNALWLRHLLGLALQVMSGAYVVFKSLPNSLWLIILLLFIAGVFKYLERTISLYLASSDKFRGSMFKASDSESDETHNPEKEDESVHLQISTREYVRERRPFKLEKPSGDLTHLDILQFAFWFFNSFKSLLVNNIFSSDQRDESREFFSKLKDEEALRILEMELSFLYAGLYTKVSVLHSWVGAVTRTITLGSLTAAFCIFHYRPKKVDKFPGADTVIIYTLFLVAIVLDLASILMVIPSDWTIAIFSRLNEDGQDSGSQIDPALNWFLGLKKLRWKKQKCCEGRAEHEVLNTPFLLKRWAGSIKMFNFIAYSVNANIERIHDAKGKKGRCVWEAILLPFKCIIYIFKKLCGGIIIVFHVSNQYIKNVINKRSGTNLVARYCIVIAEFLIVIPHHLTVIGNYITKFLGIKDLLAKNSLKNSVHSEPLTKELWAFIFTRLQCKRQRLDRKERSKTKPGKKGWASSNSKLEIMDPEWLMRYIADVDYARSLMLWHIATELCYQEEASPTENCDDRQFSKILSDYLMYLLVMQPKLMSEVAGIGKIRFRDTLAEAERFYKRKLIENSRDVKRATEEILSVSIQEDPRLFKGNHSKSVLFEASELAKKLKGVNDSGENMWRIVSKVWMELLFYAACNCDATARMNQLSKGGELLNFVWLAMAHLSLEY
ncbi:unnamed protein product [Arabidopsis thaliana]|uniref:DUF4220 domain-containing protein n=1 Tax=Arabidopsis thaliana TaxID=3702 RepID=A0A654EFN8_ARATH|nr:unnamed protein product [Arabidopsis thaliana]